MGNRNCATCFVVARAGRCHFTVSSTTDPLRMWAKKKLIEKKPLQARRRGARQQDGAHCLCDYAGQDGLSGNSGGRRACGNSRPRSPPRAAQGIEGDHEVMRRKAD